MQPPYAPPHAAAALLVAAVFAAAAGSASAEGINPNPTPPGEGPGPITGVNKTPTHLCQPGTMRFVGTTRQLSLPGVRYCTDADWSVRDVRAEGANLLWRVPFTNGHVDCACTRVAGTPTPPGPSTGEPPSPPPSTGSDRITAAIVVRELQAMGYQAEVSAGSDGDPRIATTVDSYKWAIFFYGCPKTGALEQRECLSLQFFSGYSVSQPVSGFTMNKWNSENRYTRGYTATTDKGPAARISMDVMFGNTGADPSKNFRQYFNMMKYQTTQFRKLINFN
ncbi:MAG TPA: hypothetical protein VIF14_13455 [Alphaproteobacteria bacterium]|jgi:hypothetical protein